MKCSLNLIFFLSSTFAVRPRVGRSRDPNGTPARSICPRVRAIIRTAPPERAKAFDLGHRVVSEMSSRRCGTLSENLLDPAVKADRRRAGKASKRQRPKPVMTVPDGRLEDDDWVKQQTQRGPPEKASYRGRRA
jgi:hypothetical protein